MQQTEAQHGFTMRVLRETDMLWTLAGQEQRTLVGILVTTEHLTVGKLYLLPGQHTDVQTLDGDERLYLVEGTLNIRLPDHEGQRWYELAPGDGFYLPQGVPHQYYNMSDKPVQVIFGVAPTYLPG